MMEGMESARILDDMMRMDYIEMVTKINKLIWRDEKKLEYGEHMDKNGFVIERWVKVLDV